MLNDEILGARASLTVGQLRDYLKIERAVGSSIREVFELIREDPVVLARVCNDLLPWYESYQRPIDEQIGLMTSAYGLTALFEGVAQSPDPHTALIRLASQDIPEDWVSSDCGAQAAQQSSGQDGTVFGEDLR